MKKKLLLSLFLSFSLSSSFASVGNADDDPIENYQLISKGANAKGPFEILVSSSFTGSRVVVIDALSDGFTEIVTEKSLLNAVDSVKLKAVPMNDCIVFSSWNDGVKDAVRVCHKSQIESLIPNFAPASIAHYTIESNDESLGDVCAFYSGLVYDENDLFRGSFDYDPTNERHGSELGFFAEAKPGAHFSHWEDGSTENPRFYKQQGCGEDTDFKAFFEEGPAVPVPTYSVVVLSSDSTRGKAYGSDENLKAGTAIYKVAEPYLGYEFSHWTSVNGLSLDTVSGNDTIYAHFVDAPKYKVVVLSDDTTKGVVSGVDSLITKGMPIGWKYELKPGCVIDTVVSVNNYSVYKVEGNDTIIVRFKEAKISVPVRGTSYHVLELYGNTLTSISFDKYFDSVTVTNKVTGKTEICSSKFIEVKYGDTLLVEACSNDGYKTERVELTYAEGIGDLFAAYKKDSVGVEVSEADSFDVNIFIYGLDEFGNKTNLTPWQYNGRYAKGESLLLSKSQLEELVGGSQFSSYYVLGDDSEEELFKFNYLMFVVNNNINLEFLVESEGMGVDNVLAGGDSDGLVNVYTIGGRLLMERVNRQDAFNSLGKGVYVIGRKLVKIGN